MKGWNLWWWEQEYEAPPLPLIPCDLPFGLAPVGPRSFLFSAAFSSQPPSTVLFLFLTPHPSRLATCGY